MSVYTVVLIFHKCRVSQPNNMFMLDSFIACVLPCAITSQGGLIDRDVTVGISRILKMANDGKYRVRIGSIRKTGISPP